HGPTIRIAARWTPEEKLNVCRSAASADSSSPGTWKSSVTTTPAASRATVARGEPALFRAETTSTPSPRVLAAAKSARALTVARRQYCHCSARQRLEIQPFTHVFAFSVAYASGRFVAAETTTSSPVPILRESVSSSTLALTRTGPATGQV